MRAVKHVVLPQEDAVEFKSLEAALTDELAPDGALQSILVGRIAGAGWRLERLEVELSEERNYGTARPRADPRWQRHQIVRYLLRYCGAAELWRALRTLQALQAEAGARAAAGAQAPARAAAPVRLGAGGSASPARSPAPRAAPEADPIKPKSRGNLGRPGPTPRSGEPARHAPERRQLRPRLARGAAAAVVGRSTRPADRTRDART